MIKIKFSKEFEEFFFLILLKKPWWGNKVSVFEVMFLISTYRDDQF